MGTPQERLKIFQQERQRAQPQTAAERRRLFQQEREQQQQPAGPPAEGVAESFATGAARGALDYIIKPAVTLADAVGSAATGDFQPISDLAERAGRGFLETAAAFDPAGNAYEPTQQGQAQRLNELRQRAKARLPETVNLIEAGQQQAEARPRTTVGKIAQGAGNLITSAAPAAIAGVVSGGSIPAVAATTAFQSAAQPESAALNVGLSAIPVPLGKAVAPIIRRFRRAPVQAVEGAGGRASTSAIETKATAVKPGGVKELDPFSLEPEGVENGKDLFDFRALESPLEVVAENAAGNARQSLPKAAEMALAQDMGLLVTPAEKKSVLDVITAVRKAGLLTSPKTHIRNIVGTGLFQISEEAARLPGVVADLAMAARTGKRTLSGPSITSMGRSAYEAATKGISDAVQILKKGATPEDLARLQLPDELVTSSPILNKYVNGVFRTLSAEDKIFRTYALRRSLEERAAVLARNEVRSGTIPQSKYVERFGELRNSPPAELQAAAAMDAEIATFNNQNLINDFLSGARQKLGSTPKGKWLNFAIDTVAPFTKTPTNIMARMLEYSPIGLAKGSYQVAKTLLNPVFTQAEQRQFAQTFGRGALGSAILALGWKLQDAGLMTGLYEDEASKRTLDQAAGRPAGSLKVGDTWYQITSAAPLGNLLAIGASMAREYDQERESGADTLAKTLAPVGSALMEQPLLEGAVNISDTLKGEKSLSQEAGRLAGSFIPAAVSDVAEAIDPTQREARGFLPPIEQRLPGIRQVLPPSIDALGRPLEDRGPIGAFLDPTRSTSAASAPVLAELLRLDAGLGKVKRDKTDAPEVYRQKVVRYGKLYEQWGNDLLQSPTYRRATDEQKKAALFSLSDRVKKQIADELKYGAGAQDGRNRLSADLIMESVFRSKDD